MRPLVLLGATAISIVGMVLGLDYMQEKPQREQARWDARYRESQKPIVMKVSRDYWDENGNYNIEGSAEGCRINLLRVLNGGIGDLSPQGLDKIVNSGSTIKFPTGNLRKIEPVAGNPNEPETYGFSPLIKETDGNDPNSIGSGKYQKYSHRIEVLIP